MGLTDLSTLNPPPENNSSHPETLESERPPDSVNSLPEPHFAQLDPSRTELFSEWSPWKETASAYVRTLIVFLVTVILAWSLSGWQTIHYAAWVCLIGITLASLQAYPILIASDRPDLTTPESCLKSYYQSLAHHGPLFLRMWLMMTPDARSCRQYKNFDSFRYYWRCRLKEWRHRAGVLPLTPVAIEITVESITADKQYADRVEVSYLVSVSLRGRRSLGPVATYSLQSILQKTKDDDWLITQGALPE